MQVDLGRIEAICKAKLKVDIDTVLDPESPQALIALVRKLQSLQVTRHCCSLLLVTADSFLCAMAQKDLLCSASVMPRPTCLQSCMKMYDQSSNGLQSIPQGDRGIASHAGPLHSCSGFEREI